MSEYTKELVAKEWDENSEDSDLYEIIEEGDWTQDGKYQFSSTVVQTPDGKYWSIRQSRSGSYHTDWYYNDPDVIEVAMQTETVVIKKWKSV